MEEEKEYYPIPEQRKPLNERLENIEEALDVIEPQVKKAKEKNKKFKLPRNARLNKKRVSDNWVTIIKINENKNLAFSRQKIIDQTIVINGNPVLATPEYVLNFKGNPFMIIPTWSVRPFSPTENLRKSLSDGSNNVGYALLLARMKAGLIKNKQKMSMGAMIGGLVALAVIGYIFMGG